MSHWPTVRAAFDAREITEDAEFAEVAENRDNARGEVTSGLRVLRELSDLRVKAGEEAGNTRTTETRS